MSAYWWHIVLSPITPNRNDAVDIAEWVSLDGLAPMERNAIVWAYGSVENPEVVEIAAHTEPGIQRVPAGR